MRIKVAHRTSSVNNNRDINMGSVLRRPRRWLIPFHSLCIGLTATAALAQAATVEPIISKPGEAPPAGFTVKGRANGDDVPHPAGQKRREMRKSGMEERVKSN